MKGELAMMYYTLDKNNFPVGPVSMNEYYRWHDSLPEEGLTGIGIQIGKTTRDGVTVSTVFLGLDHNFAGTMPVLWETMVFGGPDDQYQERYRSHAEALAGHEAACKQFLADVPEVVSSVPNDEFLDLDLKAMRLGIQPPKDDAR